MFVGDKKIGYISPREHRKLVRLKNADNRGIGAMIDWLICEEVKRRKRKKKR